MTVMGHGGRRLLFATMLLAAAIHAVPSRAQSSGPDVSAVLAHADATKTSDHAAFLDTLARLRRGIDGLSEDQRAHLRYLEAWQVAYAGDYEAAIPLLEHVGADTGRKTLRFRATATLVNIFGIGHRYQDAYTRLTELIDDLPAITDPAARLQGLGEAAQMLTSAGEYELAADYAERMIQSAPSSGQNVCKGTFIKLHALYRAHRVDGDDMRFARGIAGCSQSGEELFANALRADVADDALRKNRPRDAIALLETHYAAVRGEQYPSLTSQFEALLARAHLQAKDPASADKYAHAAVDSAIAGELSEPLGMALHTLYELARDRGDFPAAIDWLERYMKADKGYLDDLSAQTMAYQVVKQQVVSSRLEADALDRQNQILHLQREVDRRSMESSRLYIVLLLVVLATIVLWLVRIKRLQLRFMHLARRDSLTGICNRQHFMERAGNVLLAARKSGKPACLILFDLDHFKQVNDTYGHSEGDWVLLRVAAECRDHLRVEDIFGRLGGEEFAVILPDTDEATGARRADTIREAIAAPPAGGISTARVTASFGIAGTEPHGHDLDRLLVKADEALYRAKNGGRNRVVVAYLAGSDEGGDRYLKVAAPR